MIVDQFHAAAAAAKNTYAIDETSRLLWRAHSEGAIPDVEAHAIAAALQARRAAFSTGRASHCLCRRQGPSAALLRAGNAILVRLIAKPRSSVAAVRP